MNIEKKISCIYVYDWFLKQREYYVKYESGTKVQKKQEKTEGDSLQLSYKAQRQLKNKYIEDTINSGEPLKGITYDEYCDYIYDKYGYFRDENTEQGYRYALKGDNASLREKEWRTNPRYVIPSRLHSSPEVVQDRNAALEKYRNGEELSAWERNVMCTARTTESGSRMMEEACAERSRKRMQGVLSSALERAGVTLSENEFFDLEVWGYDITVSGNVSDEKLKQINDALSEKAVAFQSLYHMYHRDEAEKGGFPLVFLQDAEQYLKEAGGGSVFSIGKDEDGNFTGLPGDLGEFIKENAIGKFGFVVDEKYKDRKDDIEKALYMREAFNSVIETVKKGNYKKLKNMTCKLTYKNGYLSC